MDCAGLHNGPIFTCTTAFTFLPTWLLVSSLVSKTSPQAWVARRGILAAGRLCPFP